MITRRQFIQTAACVSSGAAVTLVFTSVGSSAGCADGDDSDTQTSSTSPTEPAPPAASGGCDGQGGIGATSSASFSHTHNLCVPGADLTSPPPGGATYQTTAADGHVHSVTFSADQLASLARDEGLNVTSNEVAGHTHLFTVRRVTVASSTSTSSSSGTTSTSSSGGY